MKKAAVTGLLICLLGGWAHGQQLMTLEEALSIGLTNNYGIIISQNSLQEAKNNATPGNAGMLPVVGVNAGISKGLSNARVKVLTGSELNNPAALSDLTTAGVGMTWKVFDGLKMFISFDKLRKLEEISDLSAKNTLENTIARIIAGYYEIVRQNRIQQFLSEQVEISGLRTDLAKMRYETGSGSEMEYLKSRVEQNADIARLSAQKTLCENAKTSLNDLMAREVTTTFQVPDTIPVSVALNPDSLHWLVRSANTDLLMAMRNRDAGALDVKSARASQWPTLDYFAGYNYYHSDTEANFIQYNRNFGPSMGLSLNMKIFDGQNLKRQYKNAALSLQSYDLAVQQMESRLGAHLEKLYSEYLDHLEVVRFEEENLQLAIRNMDLARESFRIGSISSIQMKGVQEDLLTARTRQVNAQYQVKLTETELMLLSGKLLH